MPVFIVAQITIRDRARYSEYEAGFMEIFGRYRGRLLAVEENPEVLEGSWPHTRTVLIEFPSREDAISWYHSDEYRTLAQLRHSSSTSDVAMVAGIGAGV